MIQTHVHTETGAQAVAKVFIQAFKSLPFAEKEFFLSELVKNKKYREDLIDLAIIEARRDEPSRPFREYHNERMKKNELSNKN